MSDFIILTLILILVICLIATLVAFVLYSGLLYEIVIKTGSPPIKNVTIAYKFKEGPYKDCGASYTESCSIGPKLNSIGIFYDDPKQTAAEKCRYVVGSVLSEGEERPDEELQKTYEKFGFKVFSLPEVTHAVTTTFPGATSLSYILGPYRVYPQLASYIQERKLSAFPFIEICKTDLISYMVPLSRQTDFFVPEVREDAGAEVKEEDSDEDQGTDITGADSHSDVSSGSGGVPWDSRETSLVASTAASLASSLPLREVADVDERAPPGDHSDRGSHGSGDSGSSFEEFDLEQIEDQSGEDAEEKEREGETAAEGEGGAALGEAGEAPCGPTAKEREPRGEGELRGEGEE